MDESISVGIDIGTSRTVVYIIKRGRTFHVKIDSNPFLLSAVAYRDGGPIAGYNAEQYINSNPKCGVRNWKRLLGKQYRDVQTNLNQFSECIVEQKQMAVYKVTDNVGEHIVKPEDCLKCLLKYILGIIKTRYTQPIKRVCLTVPATFDIYQKKLYEKALKDLEYTNVCFLSEPVAAALSTRCTEKDGLILIYDFGGGTFDTALLSYGSSKYRVIDKAGADVGGLDMDKAFYEYLKQKLEREGYDTDSINQMERNNRIKAKVNGSLESIKVSLSSATAMEIDADDFGLEDEPLYFEREEFEKVSRDKIEKTIQCMNEMLAVDRRKERVRKIILVGGSSQIPLVRTMIQNYFGCDNSFFQHADSSSAVAEGAAIFAGESREVEEVEDPEAIHSNPGVRPNGDLSSPNGIEVVGGDSSLVSPLGVKSGDNTFHRIFAKGCRCGSQAVFNFEITNTVNRTLYIEFAQGVSNFFAQNMHVATFEKKLEDIRLNQEFQATIRYIREGLKVTIRGANGIVISENEEAECLTYTRIDNERVFMTIGNSTPTEVVNEKDKEIQEGGSEDQRRVDAIVHALFTELEQWSWKFTPEEWFEFSDAKKKFYYNGIVGNDSRIIGILERLRNQYIPNFMV